MPSQEPARSPARRQPLPDRAPSSQSISRDPLPAGHLLNTHKGSSTKLHKAHAVGQGRHGHGRVPSHGKGLNKLSRLGPGNAAEEICDVRPHSRSASQTPSTSPGNLSNKRNSSNISLHRPSSKSSIKRNSSHPTLSRNNSTAKLGNQSKSQKAQTKKDLLKKGTDDAPVVGAARFEVGDEAQDDEWTEDSSSQSPVTTRTHSRPKTPVTPNPKELPTPDGFPEQRSPPLPASPPESPPLSESTVTREVNSKAQLNGDFRRKNSYSHPPDAEAVTSRLLSRNGAHTPTPRTSNIFANITPQHLGSPNLSQSQASTLINEPSLPADGISRFLSGANSNLGSVTPGSVSQLQQNLANIDRNNIRPSSPIDSASANKKDARRVKSAANLTHIRLSNGENITPPKSPQADQRPQPQKRRSQTKQPYMPSPFESARGANPSAGKSYTQLKLDLDREAVSRDPPISSHPLLMNRGSMLNMAGTISSNVGDIEKKLKYQYAQAQRDLNNSRKYYPDVMIGKIPEKAIRRYQLEKDKERRGRDKAKKDSGSGEGSSAETAKTVGPISGTSEGTQSRGRVRFEVGSRSFEDRGKDRPVSRDRVGNEGVEGLLRRMWIAPEPKEEEEGD